MEKNRMISFDDNNVGSPVVQNIVNSSSDSDLVINKIKNDNQIIFTGAPGTGKTYGIRKAVASLCNNEENYKFIQFHSSYDYSDFGEGMRPIEKDNNVSFVRMDGVFKAFCRK